MIGTPEQISKYLWSLDKEKLYEIKQYHKKRTLTSNAYAWELINQLANILRISKEDLYLKLLEDYGQSSLISVKADIDISGFVKYYKEVGRSTLNGTEFKHIRIYKGSSQFDTYEMGIFIDGIIHECENVGIPTLTKEQISKLE